MLREKDIEQKHVCRSCPGGALLAEDRLAMNLRSAILGGGMSSRLFQGVRGWHVLFCSLDSVTTPHLDTGLLSIYTGLGAETEHKALERIVRELHRFCEDGPTPDELSRCREQVKTTLLMGLENTGTRMMTIGRSELLRGQVAAVEQVLADYDKVTAEDLLELARRVFDFVPPTIVKNSADKPLLTVSLHRAEQLSAELLALAPARVYVPVDLPPHLHMSSHLGRT